MVRILFLCTPRKPQTSLDFKLELFICIFLILAGLNFFLLLFSHQHFRGFPQVIKISQRQFFLLLAKVPWSLQVADITWTKRGTSCTFVTWNGEIFHPLNRRFVASFFCYLVFRDKKFVSKNKPGASMYLPIIDLPTPPPVFLHCFLNFWLGLPNENLLSRLEGTP